MNGGNTPVVRQIYTPDQIDAAKAKAAARTKELLDEGFSRGVKHGHRWVGVAQVSIGFVLGMIFMAFLALYWSQQSIYATGAVVDRLLVRTVEPATLPAAPQTRDPSEEYQSNTARARAEACQRGVRDPRTGMCPREPSNAPQDR